MSVDDRLRAGFIANAADFIPEGEERLEQVHARLRRCRYLQTAAVVVSAAAAVAIIAALGGQWPSTQRQDPVGRPTSTATATGVEERGIPDSTWTKVVTREQAERIGVPEARIDHEFGADGLLSLTLDLTDGSYAVLNINDDGVVESGDSGTYEYDDRGRLVTTSNAPGCPRCVLTYRWHIDNDRLVLEETQKTEMHHMERVVMLGTWTRDDS